MSSSCFTVSLEMEIWIEASVTTQTQQQVVATPQSKTLNKVVAVNQLYVLMNDLLLTFLFCLLQ